MNSDQSAYFEHIRINSKKIRRRPLYKGGMRIYTTMNADMQKAAYENVEWLKAVDKRQGFEDRSQFGPGRVGPSPQGRTRNQHHQPEKGRNVPGVVIASTAKGAHPAPATGSVPWERKMAWA
jgi:membrane carboxypeptidase/penicillin-binding protein